MRTALWIIFGLSVFWFGLAMAEPKAKSVVALDGIVPPRVLDLTTPDERVLMADALHKVISTSRLAVAGSVAVGLVSACSLGILFIQARLPSQRSARLPQKPQI